MQIFILRHCKTKNNINNSWCGCNTDNELSLEGLNRNKELVQELSQIKFDVIYSSPLKRCLITAKQISEITGSKLIIDNRLIERNFGELEGKPCDDNDKLKLADLHLNTDLNNGVEKIKDMYQKRIIPFYTELFEKNFSKVLIVSHSWVLRLSKYFLDGEVDSKTITVTPKNGEYQIFNKNNNIITRNFNTIEIHGDKLIKRSSYTSKFHDEIKWMVNLPDDLKSYIPKIDKYYISDKNKDDDLSFITMEYINQKSFDQIYLKNKLTTKDALIFFKQVFAFLLKARQYNDNLEKDKIKEYLYDIYYKKTIDRWDTIKDDLKFSNFYNYEITINNIKYKSVKYYLSKLEKTLIDYNVISSNRKFWIIHGDLCFNNIIFNNNQMYVIDPRGSFGKPGLYGDQWYELAKLSHSISGYDSIINNYYQVEIKDNNINYSFDQEINKQLFLELFEKLINKNILQKIYLIESLLFLSMIPLHKENYSHQIMMLCLAIQKLSKFIK